MTLRPAALFALLLASTASAQPVPSGVFTEAHSVAGLAAPGEIVIDRAGIPHIYAVNARHVNIH